MNLKQIIRADKEITDLGDWSEGKMPRSAFPLSKVGTKGYRLGNRRWRVVRLKALGCEFRVLITYSSTLAQYQATLGITEGQDTKVLAALEHHPTHDAWHAHVACDDVKDLPSGMRRGPWVRRLRRGGNYAHRHPFEFIDDDALVSAAQFFRFSLPFEHSRQGELSLG